MSRNISPGIITHKAISFAQFLRRDPVGAVRRLRGYFRDPLFLFQMGKVGSSTHRNTLQTLYHVYHLHTHEDFKLKYEGVVRRTPRLADSQLDLITIAREPVGRKISTFFQNLVDSPYPFGFKTREEVFEAGVEGLLERFHAWEDGVEEATEWYDKHFAPATGVRIYDHPFDRERGWSIVNAGQWRILLLRFSDVRSNHVEALNQFLSDRFDPSVQIDELRSSNVSSVKWYAELMRDFRNRLAFDPDQLDRAYNSEYMRYFHTEKEIAEMRAMWRVH